MAKKDSIKTSSSKVMTVDSAILTKAIDRVVSLVNGNGANYFLDLSKECHMIGLRDGTYCRVSLGTSCPKLDTRLPIADISAFKALIKNRGDVTLEVVSNTLVITSGRYKSELKFNQMNDVLTSASLEEFSRRAAQVASKKSTFVVDDAFFSTVSKSVSATRLVNPFEEGFISTAAVTLSGKNLSVVAFDQWHIHLLNSDTIKTKTQDFSICITTGIFSLLDKVVDGQASFHMSSEDFVITGSDIVVILPPVQDNNSKAALSFVNSLPKPIVKFKTKTNKLDITLSNIAALLKGKDKNNAQIDFTIKDGVLKLGLNTDSGSVSDKFKIEGYKSKQSSDTKISVDPRIFYDTFKVMKNCDSIDFTIHPNAEGIPGIYSMRGSSDLGELIAVGYVGS